MNTAETEYEEACLAGDLAGHVEGLSPQELKELHGHALAVMRINEKQGGIPALVKWACMIEAANRSFKL